MRSLALLGLAFVLAPASHGLAASHQFQGYGQKLAPGQAVEQNLARRQGELLSGGYSLDSTDGPRSRLIVLVNGPVPGDNDDNLWRVGLLNDHDAPVNVNFRISILCD
jgi:hypothetical protein